TPPRTKKRGVLCPGRPIANRQQVANLPCSAAGYSGWMRIAVLGLGFMGSTHLKALRDIPGVETAAVYSSDENKLAGDLSGIQGNIGGPGEKLDFSAVKKFRT